MIYSEMREAKKYSPNDKDQWDQFVANLKTPFFSKEIMWNIIVINF